MAESTTRVRREVPWRIPGEPHAPGNLLGLLARVSSHPLVQPSKLLNGQAALDYTWVPGRGRLVLVLGDNGSGKSVLRRLVHAECGHTFLSVSMEERGSARALVDYGMESVESTGTVSGRALRATLARSRSRAREHVVFLDEPDIGMSDGLAAGVAQEVTAWLAEPSTCYGVFVTSHNRAMLRALVEGAGRAPHVLWFGPTGFDLTAWLDARVEPRGLDAAREHARRTEARVRIVLNGMRRAERRRRDA